MGIDETCNWSSEDVARMSTDEGNAGEWKEVRRALDGARMELEPHVEWETKKRLALKRRMW